jgi:hypothetical protein
MQERSCAITSVPACYSACAADGITVILTFGVSYRVQKAIGLQPDPQPENMTIEEIARAKLYLERGDWTLLRNNAGEWRLVRAI